MSKIRILPDSIVNKIAAGEVPSTKIYEDEVVLAFLDIGPVSAGHTLVIPKEHAARVDQCSADLLGSVCGRLGEIASAVQAATGSDGYNVLCNNGRAAGQHIEHLHFHVIPRYGSELGFIDIVGKTRVLPEGLNAVKKKIEENIHNYLNEEFFENF